MLKLYHTALSPCSQKVRLTLHQKALRYEAVVVDLKLKENLLPPYLALNPNGVVPTLVDEGRAVIESTVISEYLDDRFPEIPLRPADPLSRAQMRLWTKRVDDKIHPAASVLTFAAFLAPNFTDLSPEARAEMLAKIPDRVRRERQKDLIEHGLGSSQVPAAAAVYRQMADDIDAATTRTPWLLGNDLTLADFAVAPYVRGMELLGLLGIAPAHAERTALSAWLARVKQTEGYRHGIAAYDPPAEVNRRIAMQPLVLSKLKGLFA